MLPGANQPYWTSQTKCEGYPALSEDIEADVVVIGGGITGLTAAMRLLESSQRVVLVEMNTVGSGTTGHSTGHVDYGSEHYWQVLERKFGKEKATAALEAKSAAIRQVKLWDSELELGSYKDVPAYLYTEHERQGGIIEREHRTITELGEKSELLTSSPLPFNTYRTLRLPAQGRINPYKYICSLAAAFVKRGGKIYEHTRAENIDERNGTGIVATTSGIITAKNIVVAGHAPLLGIFSMQVRTYAYQSYVIAVRVEEEIQDALYWDTDEPYHYTRIASSDDPKLLIIGGADHPTGYSDKSRHAHEELEHYARERYQVLAVEGRWSHEHYDSADGMPFIGRVPGYDSAFIGAAYSGDGLSFGTAAGIIMSDLILTRSHKGASVFDPARIKPLRQARRMTSGILHMAKHFIGDRRGPEVETIDEVPRGEGRIVSLQGERVAVYRADDGNVHTLSPVCTHMSCIVQWNNSEKTWDCPCHGSRFGATGELISGPALKPLPAISLAAEVETEG